MSDQQQKILVPVLAGIGNAVMAVPLVRRLGRLGQVTVAARTGAMADVFRGLPEVRAVEVLGAGPVEALRSHRRIVRRLRPDLYVVPFPSNRWQYALLATMSGARRVVMHDYPVGAVRALRFLPRRLRNATLIPAERGVHDVVQNLRLSEALGAGGGVEPPFFPLDDSDRAQGQRLLGRAMSGGLPRVTSDKTRGSKLVLLQPGCGDTPVGRAKRWPAENFAQLADELVDRGHAVAVIEGPDERGLGRQVSSLVSSHPPVIELEGPLRYAAALFEMADLYVGNDSGLAHVSAAVGTPPVTLFAAADPARVAPYGYGHLVITPPAVSGIEWAPRLMYPMDHPGPRLRDARGIDWAAAIRLPDVLRAVDRALADRRASHVRGANPPHAIGAI